MITQEYKQGNHIIKMETAESLQDAKDNNFPEGIYTKCYVDNKHVDNYMAMMKFIVDNARTNNESLIPTGEDFNEQRKRMLENQQKAIMDEVKKITDNYEIPEQALNHIKSFLDKINPMGVRVKE